MLPRKVVVEEAADVAPVVRMRRSPSGHPADFLAALRKARPAVQDAEDVAAVVDVATPDSAPLKLPRSS